MATDSVFSGNDTGAVASIAGTVMLTRVSIAGDFGTVFGGAGDDKSGFVLVRRRTGGEMRDEGSATIHLRRR